MIHLDSWLHPKISTPCDSDSATLANTQDW